LHRQRKQSQEYTRLTLFQRLDNSLQENGYFMIAKKWLRMIGEWLQSYSWRPLPWGEIWLQILTASHFSALYFMGVYCMAIGNTKILHREHREHIWRTLDHITSHIFMVVTILLFGAIQKNMGNSKKIWTSRCLGFWNPSHLFFKILKPNHHFLRVLKPYLSLFRILKS